MKRDMDLARSILLALEESNSNQGWVDIKIEGHAPEEVWYHIMLLHEAGLIKALDVGSFGRDEWKAERLTWAGHEFLESSRNEGIWKRAKKIVAEKAGGLTFEVLKQVLIQLGKEAVSGA